MCGIYGSIERGGHAPQIVFAGLKDIEYRGYDSWGIAYAQDGKFGIAKETGFLPNQVELPNSPIAIGHTRWATHGGVTRANAHPHTDCTQRLALVHNGIIENASELREKLTSHKFLSETDTEVVAHLIEQELLTTHPFSEAVQKAFSKLTGCNGLLVSNGTELVAITQGSSLVAGRTDSGFVVSSDPNALLPHTRDLHFLKDNQPVVMSVDGSNSAFQTVDWEYVGSSQGNFPHFMLKEIMEQPQALENLLRNPNQFAQARVLLDQARTIFLVGCGSAYFATLAGSALFSEHAGRLVWSCAGSEFGSKQRHLTSADTLVSISQSGETIDLLEQVRLAKQTGVSQLAMVNRFGSALYREVPQRIMLEAGVEKCVAATKSFTNMLGALILLTHPQGETVIRESITGTQAVLERATEIEQIAKLIAEKRDIFILGEGLSYIAALETALKIKETSYIHAEAFQGGELKHGVLALIEADTPVLALTPNENPQDSLTHIAEVKARKALTIGAGSHPNNLYDAYFDIKNTGADSIIPKTVFGQLLSYYVALERGLNPDKPRNLAKSVTVK